MFEEKWCMQAKQTLKLSHPEWCEEKVDKALHIIYAKRMVDPKCMLVNNYRNISTRTTLSAIFNMLIKGHVILGGDGCIFVPHENNLSLIAIWILDLLKERKQLKKMRDKYPKGSTEWQDYDLQQSNKKIMINSLYGILGYMKFYLFNVNLAQATTAMGQAIISTATCHFENFISDNIKFVNTTELVIYITNIVNDYYELSPSDLALFKHVPAVTAAQVADRLSRKIAFDFSQSDAMLVSRMLAHVEPECLKMLYYMNNMDEFLNLPYMVALNVNLIDSITLLHIGDIDTFDHLGESWNPTIAAGESKSMLMELIHYLKVFVLYKHQIFDRVRRTKYTNKQAVLYIDTDSNMLSTMSYVAYAYTTAAIKENETEFEFKTVNIFTMILTMSIAEVYHSFYLARNISDEYGKLLGMKNEFYYPIFLLGMNRKRYIARILLQEGKLIENPDKQRLIAGYDFKKAGTKPAVRNKCIELIDKYILFAKEIDLADILRFVTEYKRGIGDSIKSGDMSYFKQLTVQPAARYKAPMSNQGYKSAFLWNAFTPENEVAFPVEVDIIPVTLDTNMTNKRYLLMRENPEVFFNSKDGRKSGFYILYTKHHDIFMNYYNNVLMQPNDYLWTMSVNSIAKPRSYESPEWLSDVTNISKITSDIVNLINPIIEPLGLDIQRTSSTSLHYTNIVDI